MIAASQNSVAQRPSGTRTALVVARNATMRTIYDALLAPLGWATRHAGTAAEARAHLAQAPTELALVELDLPGGPGEELMAALTGKAVPTIAVGPSSVPAGGAARGAAALTRPFDVKEFASLVQRMAPKGPEL